jgi:PAS domain S-box-containing protein
LNRLALERFGAAPQALDRLIALSAAAIVYGSVAEICIALSRFGGVVAQIWLPNALTVVALGFVAPRLRVPVVVGAAFGCVAANATFAIALPASATLVLANVLEIVLAHGAVGLARGGIVRRGAQRLVLAWVLGALAAPAVTGAIAAAGWFWFAGASFEESYRDWLVSDAFALAIVLPWLLRGRAPQTAAEWRPAVLLEFGVLLALSLAISAASARYIEFPFVVAALLPIFTAARLPLGPQIALAGVNALALVAWVNLEPMLALAGASAINRASLASSAMLTFLPSVFIAFVFDSMRRQSTALADEDARWRSVMQSSPIGMALVTPDGAFVEVNGALAHMLGYAPAELLATSMLELTDPEDVQATLDAEERVARGEQDVVRLQNRYRHRDGSVITAIVALSPLRGPDGTTRLLLKQVEDITARLSAERALAEALERQSAEARFRAAVEVAPTAMVIVDQRGAVTLVNAQVERAFGWRRDELIGRSIEVLIPARYGAAHRTQREAFLASPQTRRMGEGRDLYALRKDGSEFPVEVGLAAFETSEGSFVMAALVDITQRKRGEADILRANADLEEFAYIVSHDLRTPLRAIDNLVEWIVDDLGAQAPAAVGRNLHRLQLRARRMENLIQDLFNYLRAGQARAPVEPIELGDLVRRTADDLGVGDSFRVTVRAATGTLHAARTPLETVLRNLLANAVRHHDRGGGAIDVQARTEGAFHVISVTDDGPGIAPADHVRIFKPFQTLAPVEGDHVGGIGLAIVKRWVEAFNGSIAVHSPVHDGRGSRFTVRWPSSGA